MRSREPTSPNITHNGLLIIISQWCEALSSSNFVYQPEGRFRRGVAWTCRSGTRQPKSLDKCRPVLKQHFLNHLGDSSDSVLQCNVACSWWITLWRRIWPPVCRHLLVGKSGSFMSSNFLISIHFREPTSPEITQIGSLIYFFQ